MQLSDIVADTKTDIHNHIKKEELTLFRKIQEINNDNVSKVHEKIKEYFIQEAEAYKDLNNAIIKNYTNLKVLILINLVISAVLLMLIILK